MSGSRRRGITCIPPRAPGTLALPTPQGFELSSRGQGHAPGARRPRIKPLRRTDPEGVAPFGPYQGREALRGTRTVGSTHGYSCCSPPGSTERPNLFGSLTGRTSGLPQKQSSGIGFGPDHTSGLSRLLKEKGASHAERSEASALPHRKQTKSGSTIKLQQTIPYRFADTTLSWAGG
jgi:hypothetical protein